MASRPLTATPTQYTAPVLEYRCLFTSDLRRKQKRWQDGRLKFHTFNKRIMVYDDGGNVVGDTHWTQEHNFDEGEELELERSGKLVQVTEFEGKRNQDLTELLEKRLKEREERVAMKTSDSLQKPSKRRKPNDYLCKSGYAQGLTGAKLALSAKSTSSPQTRPPEAENVRAINRSSAHTIQTKRHRAKAKTRSQTSPPKESYASYMSAAQLMLRCNLSGATLATGCADKSFGEMEHGKSKNDNASSKEGVSKVEYFIESPKLSGVFTQRNNSGRPAEPFATTGANIRLQHSSVVEPYTSKAQERSSLFEQSKPLRIKSRPKKKLLYMDNPQPRPQASLASRTNSCESIPVKESILSLKDPKDSRKMPGTRAAESQVTVRDNMLIIEPNTERPKFFTSPKHRCSIYVSNKQALSEQSLLRDMDNDKTLDINAEKDFLHPLKKVSTQKQLPLTAAGPNNTLETAETPLIIKPLSSNIYGRAKRLTAKLGTRPNLGKNAAQMGDATGEVSDGSACVLKNFYPDNGGERDKGPWSREAFDLFDWNPSIEAPTTANR